MVIELKTTQPVTRFAAVIVVKQFFHKMGTSVLVVIVLSFPVLSSRNDRLRFNVFFLDKIALSTHLDFAVLIPEYID